MTHTGSLAVAAGLLLSFATYGAGAETPHSVSLYVLTKTVSLGVPDRWDYLSYEPASHRIYAAHGTTVDVLDGRTGEPLGKVPVPGANGIAIVTEAGKGYAGSRTNKSVVVFDLKTLEVTQNVPVGEDTDAVVYDPAAKRVFVMEGDPHKAVAIDIQSDTVAGEVALSGGPEFAVVDGAGQMFVNIEDRKALQRIDTHTLKVTATWPLAQCESPHGLALDVAAKRLFSTCINSKMMVIDATNGRIVQTVPIGQGSDGAAFDSARQRAFSSNGGSGSLTVVQVAAGDKYDLLQQTPTQPLARTMTVDVETGRVYLLSGDRIEVDATATNPRKRYAVAPGSARLLFLDPAP
jgi:DNA-binding beta-propeller fold protein YncE